MTWLNAYAAQPKNVAFLEREDLAHVDCPMPAPPRPGARPTPRCPRAQVLRLPNAAHEKRQVDAWEGMIASGMRSKRLGPRG